MLFYLIFLIFPFFLRADEVDQSVLVDHSPAASSENPAASFTYYLFLFGLFFFMWFVVIRPQKKQQKEKDTFLQNLSAGQQVTTTGGLIGRVLSLHETYVILDFGQGPVRVLKSAIMGTFQSEKNTKHKVLNKTASSEDA